VLQERAFERVGSSQTIRVDVRVIATSNRDLEGAVRAGEFRQDLYFRLNVLPLTMPPLRERIGDLDALASHFLSGHGKRFSAEAMKLLARHDWPGNVRELQNICERAAVLTPGEVVYSQTIAPWLRGPSASGPTIEARKLEEVERETIVRTLDRYQGHRQRTAAALGIGVRTLGLKLKRWKEQNLVAATL
jgi:two-component system, NtrC family, response regulator HydG